MKISIITVAFNSAETIEQTILSVINQSYSKIEYIIVDGKSSDNTLEIIDKYNAGILKDEEHFYNLRWMEKTVLVKEVLQ